MAPPHGAPGWTYPAQGRGRPSLPQQVQTLIVPLATEHPRRGYQHIRGELLDLDCQVSASTITRILHPNGLQPAQERPPGGGAGRGAGGQPPSWPVTSSP
jgi:hypothetical protein